MSNLARRGFANLLKSRQELKRRKRRRLRKNRNSLMQQLEDRRMLAVLSAPSEPLPTVSGPLAAGLGTFSPDASVDAIAFNSQGQFTLAAGGASDDWQTIGIGSTALRNVSTTLRQFSRLISD